ncbi:MAG: DegV family protein, partial [Desulfobacteraceae bacterium]
NLRISLAPLKFADHEEVSKRLLMAATGNSGNIAGAFFSEFTRIETCDGILKAAAQGNQAAWSALQDPQPGTMLSAFTALAEALQTDEIEPVGSRWDRTLEQLKGAVLSTAGLLAELRQADVVDSGALGIYLFFEGFFTSLSNQWATLSNPYELFGDKLKLSLPAQGAADSGYCIDTVVIPTADMDDAVRQLSALGEHVVTVSDGKRLKVHLHARDASAAQKSVAGVGDLLRWKSEKIQGREHPWKDPSAEGEKVHIVTDAAGSLTREAAGEYGVTLLDSYILLGEQHLPESMVPADKLYEAMSQGVKVTTAQASNFERHQHYEYLTQRFSSLLYLCVGSVYTGNFEIASQWSGQNQNGGRMEVVDTGAASGRLGLIARQVARYARAGNDLGQVIDYAHGLLSRCDELIFLDQLKYLAAGGRISKSRGFFGDLLNIKPIIRPGSRGAEKIGTVKNHTAQVEFLLDHLGKWLERDATAQILLQYTDNRERVTGQIQPRIQTLWPKVRISAQPMSLTSGVHMGPGTWAAAFLPQG